MTEEKFLEFARKSGLLGEYGVWKWSEYRLKQFAELVALECFQICHQVHEEYGGEDVQATWCASEIAKQFFIYARK